MKLSQGILAASLIVGGCASTQEKTHAKMADQSGPVIARCLDGYEKAHGAVPSSVNCPDNFVEKNVCLPNEYAGDVSKMVTSCLGTVVLDERTTPPSAQCAEVKVIPEHPCSS